MSLSLRLDHNLNIISEPGYFKFFGGQETNEAAVPADSTSQKQLWHDRVTGTIALKPLQLQSDWLNSSDQVSSILRLNADFNASATDLANGAIFEASAGNPNNPYIFHAPVSPLVTSPNVSPVGITTPIVITPIVDKADTALGAIWQATPGAPIPFPTATNDMKALVESKNRLAANQALYLRWFHPDPRFGHQCVYVFYIGQYALLCRTTKIEIFRDVSPGGDRSILNKEYEFDIFAPNAGNQQTGLQPFGTMIPVESPSQDRALIWFPYHRNKVLIVSHTGNPITIWTRSIPQRLADNTDWDITRSDTLLIWALTPSPGRFQIQKLKYEPGPATLDFPPFELEYTPSVAPVVSLNADFNDHGTVLSGAVQDPPAYTLPASPTADDCPVPQSDSSAQGRTYGLTLTFQSSPDQQWTPQYYGTLIRAARTFQAPATSVTVVNDVGVSNSRIMSARLRIGEKPGDASLDATLLDVGLFPLAAYYYRSRVPVQLQLTGTPAFTGYTEPIEVRPLRYNKEREMTVRAQDRWKALQETYLRDQTDWTSVGHITVVDSIAQQAGIDTSTAEYPSNWFGSLAAEYNTPLGGPNLTSDNLSGNAVAGWKPQTNDTAADFILRIADVFSGWVVGFRLDGTFFYLPRYYFTTSALTFYSSTAANPAGPLYRNPVEFRTVEPEGNIVQVVAQLGVDGHTEKSGLFIDWASLKNPAAPNYLGAYKWHVRDVGGTFTCSQLNWMAYTIFQEARRRHRLVSFQADFVPTLKIGQIFTLQNYGDYRLTGIQASLVKDNWEQADYTGELLEAGY